VKVASVACLPFHRWVLADTVAALRALGVEVVEFDHVPTHPHDWAQNNRAMLAALGMARPDALLMADYPYGPFRDAAGGAPVFATRHSLAARGNTWAPEQAEADYLATFGAWDEALLDARGANLPPSKRLRVGCPWAGPVLTGAYSPPVEVRAMSDLRPTVAWCPTWNDWSPDIAAELATLLPDVRIVYRPHYATAWRNPAALDRARALGFTVDDPLAHPANLLLQADVLVGDVSGIVLLALAVPGASLPIVTVELPPGTTGPQIERWGPEWTHRLDFGLTTPPGFVADSVRAHIDGSNAGATWADDRKRLRAYLFGDDPLPGGLTPGQRLAKEIVCRIG
jgi:hypothetical protein